LKQFDARIGSENSDEADLPGLMVGEYEKKHYPVIDAIHHKSETGHDPYWLPGATHNGGVGRGRKGVVTPQGSFSWWIPPQEKTR